MQICVWRLVGNISFSQIAFVGEPFSLTTVTRFLRGDRESGKHLLTACSYLFDNFGLRYKVHDCYRYDISYHIQD